MGKRVGRKTQEIRQLILIAIISIAISCYALSKTPFYTNDEILMRSIASGEFTGKPDGHLVYIMSALGWFIAFLYRMIPDVQWYDVLLWSLHISSLGFISYGVTRFVRNDWARYVGIIFTYIFLVGIDFSMLVYSMYTIIAAVLFATGMVYLILYIELARTRNVYGIVSIVFFMLSLLVRKQVFLMGTPLACLYIFLALIKNKKNIMVSLTRYGVILFSAIIVICGIEYINYSSEEWREYLELNDNRTVLEDYYGIPVYQFAEESYNKLGWEEADYAVLSMHNIAFSGEFTIESSKELVDAAVAIAKSSKREHRFRYVLSRVKREFFDSVYQPVCIIGLLFAVLSIVLGVAIKKYHSAFFTIGILVYDLFFSFVFLYLDRLPERVSYGLYFISAITICMNSMILLREIVFLRRRNALSILVLLVISIPLLHYFFSVQEYRLIVHEEEARVNCEMAYCLENYCMENDDCIFFVSSSVGNCLSCRMMESGFADRNNVFQLNTWIYGSPVFETKKSNAGIGVICDYLLQNEKAYVIQKGDAGTDWISNFYYSKGIENKVEIVDWIDCGDVILDVVSINRY